MRTARCLLCLTALAAVAVSCATSPTGRRQLKLFPAAEMDAMGLASFDELKSQRKISADIRVSRYVQCVAGALTPHLAGPMRGGWEVVVFDDPTANAFALPGKKIGVYTGLLTVAKNQDQLAAVVGHEIGHVVAEHSNERLSQNYATQAGMTAAAIFADSGSAAHQSALAALGLGAQYGVLLPYSRAHESEADVLGLDAMARAGFDPEQSVELWRNMARSSGGQPPELLSTHPSHATRIEALEARMPEALALREAALGAGLRPDCEPLRPVAGIPPGAPDRVAAGPSDPPPSGPRG